MEPEERSVGDGADGVGALGAVVAEAGALAAGDEERGDLAGAEEFLAFGDIGGAGVALGGLDGGGLEGARGGGGFAGILEHGLHAADGGEVEGGDLGEERGLRGGVERVPETEDVALPVGFEKGLGFGERHGVFLLCCDKAAGWVTAGPLGRVA